MSESSINIAGNPKGTEKEIINWENSGLINIYHPKNHLRYEDGIKLLNENNSIFEVYLQDLDFEIIYENLNTNEKFIFLWHFHYGFSRKECAEKLKISLKAFRKLRHDLQKKLIELLELPPPPRNTVDTKAGKKMMENEFWDFFTSFEHIIYIGQTFFSN